MSFRLELEVDALTMEQGRAVERACRERGAWPVELAPVPQRSRLRPWSGGKDRSGLAMAEELDGRHLLSDQADWNQLALEDAARPLAAVR